MSLLELFCDVDDFWLRFEPHWKVNQLQAGKQRERQGQLSLSEVMTILIHFHQSHNRTFKAYYTEYIQVQIHRFFCENPRCPRRVFTERLPRLAEPSARRTDRLREAIVSTGWE